ERVNALSSHSGLTAAQKIVIAMRDIATPIVTTSLVLAVAFVPFYFYPGIHGILYKQFALAIIIPIIVSTILALTLSPAMASMGDLSPSKLSLNRIFKADSLLKVRKWYLRATIIFVRKSWLVAILLAIFLAWSGYLASSMKKSFVPNEDL